MSVLRSMGELQVRPDGTSMVSAKVHLDGSTWMQCCTYPDRSPILSVVSGPVEVSVGIPDWEHVTAEDVAMARQLAAMVAKFAVELERLAAGTGEGKQDTSKPSGQAA